MKVSNTSLPNYFSNLHNSIAHSGKNKISYADIKSMKSEVAHCIKDKKIFHTRTMLKFYKQ